MVNAVCDSSGFCQFLQPSLDDIRDFYGALYGERGHARGRFADQAWQMPVGRVGVQPSAPASAPRTITMLRVHQARIPSMVLVFERAVWDVPQAAKQRMPAQDDLFTGKASEPKRGARFAPPKAAW